VNFRPKIDPDDVAGSCMPDSLSRECERSGIEELEKMAEENRKNLFLWRIRHEGLGRGCEILEGHRQGSRTRTAKDRKTSGRGAVTHGCGCTSVYLASKGLLRSSRLLQYLRVSLETQYGSRNHISADCPVVAVWYLGVVRR